MATVGEKKERLALKKVKVEKLKDAKAYWMYLEQEGKHCLRDI